MLRRRWFWIVILLFVVPHAGAQDDPAPLVFFRDAAVYSWTGDEATRLDACLPDDGLPLSAAPTLAPDRSFLVYESIPAVVQAAIEREGPVRGGKLPTDIYLCSLPDLTRVAVSVQPADAAYLEANIPENVIVRSAPVISPDGERIAWTQLSTLNPANFTLVIYQVSNQIAFRAPLDIENFLNVPVTWPIAYSESGIHLHGTVGPEYRMYTYSEEGEQIADVRLAGEEPFPNRFTLPLRGGELALVDGDGGVARVDPLTGDVTFVDTPVIALQSPLQDTRLEFRPGEDRFTLFTPDAVPLILTDFAPGRFGLSPDGRAVTVLEGEIIVWDNQGARTFPPNFMDVSWVGWGPAEWNVFEDTP